jgi:hypothetical protein
MPNFPSAGPSFGDLTALANVKAWLQTGQNAFPATDDALLTRLITAASQYIQTWLNRQITLQDWIEVRDGSGNSLGPGDVRYQFAAFPVTAVSLVDAPQGETLGRIKPLSNSSANCFFNSANSEAAILYGAREIGAVPGTSSIEK